MFDYGVQDLKSDEEDHRFRTTVVVRRYGEAIFPVDVVVTFKDGKQVREHWDGRGRWNRYTYTGESQAVSAQVDPERVLLLDVELHEQLEIAGAAGPMRQPPNGRSSGWSGCRTACSRGPFSYESFDGLARRRRVARRHPAGHRAPGVSSASG